MDDFETSVSTREIIKDKLRQNFDGKIVRKDLTKKIKEGANVPTYVLEFLIGQYCSSDDDEIIQKGVENVKRILADNYVRPIDYNWGELHLYAPTRYEMEADCLMKISVAPTAMDIEPDDIDVSDSVTFVWEIR